MEGGCLCKKQLPSTKMNFGKLPISNLQWWKA